jgi:hypothetical protein
MNMAYQDLDPAVNKLQKHSRCKEATACDELMDWFYLLITFTMLIVFVR